MTVSREDIRYAYRLLLNREPGEADIAAWTGYGTLQDLRARFIASAEFHERVGRELLAAAPPPERVGRNVAANPVEWRTDPDTERRLLDHVQKVWTSLGRERPHWSVLTADVFLPDRIQETRAVFFESGKGDLDLILASLARHGLSPEAVPRVLEFGCGVGRVTPHLAGRFEHVTATDISISHLDMAREVTAAAGRQNVTFTLAELPSCGMTEPFDLWFSNLVLQHNPPPVMALVLQRAFAMLAPGGVALFQVPTYALTYRFELATYLDRELGTGEMETHCLPQPVVFALAHQAGCVPLEVREDDFIATPAAWLSNTFLFRKPT